MRGFTLIEMIMVIAIVVILLSVFFGMSDADKERQEFMAYCYSKGATDRDCKWEWKRMQNGEKSIIFSPIIIGR